MDLLLQDETNTKQDFKDKPEMVIEEVDISVMKERAIAKLKLKKKMSEELLTSVDSSKLPDKGEKIENNIKEIERMLEHLESDDGETIKNIYNKICVNRTTITSKITKNTRTDGNKETKSENVTKEDEINSLIDSVTSRFSKLKLGVNDGGMNSYRSTPEYDERWSKLILGSDEYEALGGINRKKTKTISHEEATEINEVNYNNFCYKSFV